MKHCRAVNYAGRGGDKWGVWRKLHYQRQKAKAQQTTTPVRCPLWWHVLPPALCRCHFLHFPPRQWVVIAQLFQRRRALRIITVTLGRDGTERDGRRLHFPARSRLMSSLWLDAFAVHLISLLWRICSQQLITVHRKKVYFFLFF